MVHKCDKRIFNTTSDVMPLQTQWYCADLIFHWLRIERNSYSNHISLSLINVTCHLLKKIEWNYFSFVLLFISTHHHHWTIETLNINLNWIKYRALSILKHLLYLIHLYSTRTTQIKGFLTNDDPAIGDISSSVMLSICLTLISMQCWKHFWKSK